MAEYTRPKLREKLKARIQQGTKGGKVGQWSARKAQILAAEYEKNGGGYRGKKKKTQRSLDKWSEEKWTTSDGKKAVRKSKTRRYLPKDAWDKLSPSEKRATEKKKQAGSKKGQQYVRNTSSAKQARKKASKSAEGQARKKSSRTTSKTPTRLRRKGPVAKKKTNKSPAQRRRKKSNT